MLNRSKIISPSASRTTNNVSLTLPITCQICLGRVKDPSVCPNLHAFCSTCINMWLEKSKQCPTCRTNINPENPCRRVLGGLENFDDADQLKPADFSHESIRKARYLNIFEQYEDEISRLCKHIDSLNNEMDKIKDLNTNISLNSTNHEDYHNLKTNFENIQKTFGETKSERDQLKEANKKLESENSILMQDIMRLKINLSEKNSQISNKYTVAALETKVENYEKEIKKLQKALERSDKYIADLEENKTNDCKKETKTFSLLYEDIKLETTSNVAATLLAPNSSATKNGIISQNSFYGSPSKTPSKTASNAAVSSISSFSDRLKKANNIQSTTNTAAIESTAANNMNWFSPMKRLRLEEVCENTISNQKTPPKLESNEFQNSFFPISNYYEPNAMINFTNDFSSSVSSYYGSQASSSSIINSPLLSSNCTLSYETFQLNREESINNGKANLIENIIPMTSRSETSNKD